MNINEIFKKAQKCKKCYGNTPIYVPYPDPKNGKSGVKIMFIYERPGRIGTGKSGYISFENDDPTARRFKKLFEKLSISRNSIFITNACLCHPKDDGYTDTVPSTREIKNCHFWLKKQIDIINPRLIVTLGNIPLKSVKFYFKKSEELKNFTLKKDIGKVIKETSPWIYPIYHTSLRARSSRTEQQQTKDWIKLKKILKEL